MCGVNPVTTLGEWWENRTTGIAYRSPWLLDGFGPDGVILIWIGWQPDDIQFLN